jgi:hypothetical protein
MNRIWNTKLRRPILLALFLATTSLGLGGCYTKDGKWAPWTYAECSRGDASGCDRDNGSDSSSSSNSSSGSPGL